MKTAIGQHSDSILEIILKRITIPQMAYNYLIRVKKTTDKLSGLRNSFASATDYLCLPSAQIRYSGDSGPGGFGIDSRNDNLRLRIRPGCSYEKCVDHLYDSSSFSNCFGTNPAPRQLPIEYHLRRQICSPAKDPPASTARRSSQPTMRVSNWQRIDLL